MSTTARYYVLTFLAAASVGALWGTLVGGVLNALIGACAAVVIVALSGPRMRGILSSSYNMPFSSGARRRNTGDD